MNAFLTFLDEKFSGPMASIAEQKHLKAIRDGIIATLPIILVGSIFLTIAFFPFPEEWAIRIWLKANATTILLPYRMSAFIMALYASWGIGNSLAKSYELDGISGANIAAVAFLMTHVPQATDDFGLVLPMANLGGGGLFVCIIVSLLAVEIMRIILKSNFKISMPPSVPESVARSFENLTPMAVVIFLFGSITHWFKFDWYGVIGKLLGPVVKASDSLPGVLVIVLLITLFWSAGVHGVSVIGSIARPVWQTLYDANQVAMASGLTGKDIPNIAPEPFYQWFIWIGGAGATIGLGLCLVLFAKSQYAKILGKTSIIPCLFNINEPLMFGAPVVLNPVLIIPFIIAPIVNTIIAYAATSIGLIGRVIVQPAWTLPAPLGAFLATNSFSAVLLVVGLIVLDVLIYYPFFRIYDNNLLKEELANDNAN